MGPLMQLVAMGWFTHYEIDDAFNYEPTVADSIQARAEAAV